MKGKVTAQSVKDWCGNWRPGDAACVQSTPINETVREAHADCATGDLWTEGVHYRFDGAEDKDKDFSGYVAIRNAETGKRIGMSNAARGREFGALWLTLCPMGWPYDQVPVQPTFESDEAYGEAMGHNGSVMFFHQKQDIIVYLQPKASIAASTPPNTVLFRGWSVPNEGISGIAYTYKKGCPPAPYRVDGYDNQGLQLTLRGAAPVRKGCEVVGYSDKSPNAKLVLDRAE